ncbi:TRAP transporter small permease subunit [Marinobacterium litorale]|uniref:TRAP transporter small permease subunit n=1 Tax=Marinobacterium litorale TaxID=404770 RepID=UPI0009FDDA95|nr:TRAP transporter small permease subunit [Marinobacterium litorale]
MSNNSMLISFNQQASRLEIILKKIGNVIAWVNVALIGVIITQVVLRKFFASGSIMLEELQWHLYSIAVMFGLTQAQLSNSNVRVDIFSGLFSQRTKSKIEILGLLFLVTPFIIVQFMHSLDFVYNSWRINESSTSPSGLPWRWAIKSVIPLSLAMLFLAVLVRIIQEIQILKQGQNDGC